MLIIINEPVENPTNTFWVKLYKLGRVPSQGPEL